MVGALGGNWGNIKCWQATKPRQPQRKEEMRANELKEEVVEKGLSRFVFFLAQIDLSSSRCGTFRKCAVRREGGHFAVGLDPSKKWEKKGKNKSS